MQLSICERFPAVSPFEIRKQRFSEVFLLLRRLNNNSKNKDTTNKKHYEKQEDGKTRIYIPVVD